MLKGINVNQRIEFVSSKDTEEPKTVFVLRPLTGEEKANFNDDGSIKLAGTRIYDFLSLAVVEIKNYEVEGTVREKLVSIKDDSVIAEIINEIGKISNMTGQDQKN
jgi:hypothetical protein